MIRMYFVKHLFDSFMININFSIFLNIILILFLKLIFYVLKFKFI